MTSAPPVTFDVTQISDTDGKQLVILSTERNLTREQAARIREQLRGLFIDWNNPPRVVVVEAMTVTVIHDAPRE